MFRTKPISSNAMTTPKPPKTNNVPINEVVVVVTTQSQQSEQQVFKERELVKTKWVELIM
jgi:hypothetical protein